MNSPENNSDRPKTADTVDTAQGDHQRIPHRTLLVGCGRTATRLGESLVAAGGEVVALRRTTGNLPRSFQVLSVDLVEPLEQPLPDVDAMVITLSPSMGEASTQIPAQEQAQSPWHPTGYLDALTHLSLTLPAVPPRVVFVSSTRVFEGKAGEQVLTEQDEPAPTTPRGRLLRDAELLAIDLFDAHIVRPAGIYGPDREMMVRKVLNHTPVQYAQRTNRIHEVDLARALEVMLTLENPPTVVHAVDQRPATMGEVVTFIADQLGVAPPPAMEPAMPGGTVLSGELLLTLLGSLRYPTFEAGYGVLG